MTAPWNLYSRFFSTSVLAFQAYFIFLMLYHLPEWRSEHRLEVIVVFLFLTLRFGVELYWSIDRSLKLAFEGILIPRRPFLGVLLMTLTVIWLIATIVRRIKYIQHRSGQFIVEAILLGVLLIPATAAQAYFSMGLISRSTAQTIQAFMAMIICPMIVLVFFDMLSEAITLLVRLLGVTLVIFLMTVSGIAWIIGPLFEEAQALHTAMIRMIAITVFGSAIVLLGLPIMLSRSVFRPLEQVLRGVDQVKAGNLNVQVPVHFEDEIGTLTDAFNRMVGDVRGMVNTLETRVTERTAELAQSETRYRELVEQIDEIIFRIALPETRIEYLSPSVERTLGYPVTHLNSTAILMERILHPSDAKLLDQRLNEMTSGQVTPSYEYRVIDAQGQERWIHQSNTGIYQSGQLIAIEGVCRDVTLQKQAEAQMRRNESELAALAARERIGRDLHDGLGQVMGYVNVQTQTASALMAGGQVAQAKLILSQLTKVAQDAHADIRRYILDLRQPVAENTVEDWTVMLRQHIETFSQRYTMAVDLKIPTSLLPNPFEPAVGQEVLQIVIEALNNARKHAQVETVQVSVQSAKNHITIIIADNGVGFTYHEDTESLIQAHRGRFGLQIMAERAAAINAQFQIQSAPGIGTQVVIYIPAENAPVSEVDENDPLRNLRVLLVDDHQLFRSGIQNMLALRGIKVIGMAQDGIEAQELAQQLRPDLILMDMQMPRCDGISATAAIKAILPDIKIIMLTVAAEQEKLFQALKVGASGYLLKNLDSDEFFLLLVAATRGEVVLSQELANQTLKALEYATEPTMVPEALSTLQSPHQRLTLLSPRQREILERVAQGQTYKLVAIELHITEATVKYHMGQIIELLQVSNRREAVSLAKKAFVEN